MGHKLGRSEIAFMKKLLTILSSAVLLASCIAEKQVTYPDEITKFYAEKTIGRADDYYPRELRPSEKRALIDRAFTLDGLKYVWGGDDPVQGIDCSGLVIWAFQSLGYLGFRYNNVLVSDLTADLIFKYNITYGEPLSDPFQLLRYSEGDVIFYDVNRDGRMEHIAIFSHYDPQTGEVWVVDASTGPGKTSKRAVPDFFNKNPFIGRLILYEKDHILP